LSVFISSSPEIEQCHANSHAPHPAEGRRQFDHYFGTFPGVRGFSDRFTLPLSGGRKVWEQQGKGRRVAGRVETGAHSISDPLMGKPV
jgi:hypothetical protein